MSVKLKAIEAQEIEARIAAQPAPDLTDTDNPELTAADFARMKPASELAPEILAYFPKTRGRGRPPVAAPKEHVSLRIAPDVLRFYRAKGKGWQAEIEAALRLAMSMEADAKQSAPDARS
jgi:uncharacterized protein (DUF4415 family)